jgi:hypothetical protein
MVPKQQAPVGDRAGGGTKGMEMLVHQGVAQQAVAQLEARLFAGDEGQEVTLLWGTGLAYLPGLLFSVPV